MRPVTDAFEISRTTQAANLGGAGEFPGPFDTKNRLLSRTALAWNFVYIDLLHDLGAPHHLKFDRLLLAPGG